MSNYSENKSGIGFQWIKSRQSGRTYLCPVGAISDSKNVSDRELSALCIDESNNPQND